MTGPLRPSAAPLALLAALFSACGYRVSGRADLLPRELKTIAIPAFGNVTTRHRLADRLPAAITREFISRTRYAVVADPNQAQATLSGALTAYNAYPTIFDRDTGRAAGLQINVTLQIQLTEHATGKVLFRRDPMEVRNRYEISVDPAVYLDESSMALERLAQDVARQVVSAILEAF